MYKYSKISQERLSTCHEELQLLFNEVLKKYDHAILCGHRGEEEQNKAFSEGNSKLKWPNGNHNAFPSNAVDAMPCPIDWSNTKRINDFAAQVIDIAHTLYDSGAMKHKIRWGGDWDGDPSTKNKFNDLVHFELRPIK